MTIFILTFVLMIAVVAVMAVGVMFGRGGIKGSCGGVNGGSCVCIKKHIKKCAKKRHLEMAEKV